MGDAWEDAKLRHPVGSRVDGVVRVRRPFGVFVELDGAPEVIAFLDIASYNPDPPVDELPEAGEGVSGEVAFHDDRKRQIRVRVGAPFWNEDARRLSRAVDSGDSRQINEAGRDFVEKLTFATADEILTVLREILAEDWMALPPWARNLAYRLACLQRPDDPRLLREAAADLLCFGPDWDAFAEELKGRAAELEQ